MSNILLGKRLNIILADYGEAEFENIDQIKNNAQITTYSAPEVIEEQVYDGRKADIFALGVLFFSMIAGRFPFYSSRDDDYDYALLIEK